MKSSAWWPEGDLVAAELVRVLVERAPPQPCAERAERLARLDLLLDGQVDPRAPHLVGVALAGEALLDQVRPEPGKSLVDVQGQELEPDRRAPLGEPEQMQERPGVLAAGDPDQDPVSRLDQAEVSDRLPEARHQASLEALDVAHLEPHRGARGTASACMAGAHAGVRPPGRIGRIVAPTVTSLQPYRTTRTAGARGGARPLPDPRIREAGRAESDLVDRSSGSRAATRHPGG